METARTGDRARAANALGRAYAKAEINGIDRQAAEMAMTFLLDDPSPKVRLALVEALADCSTAPRAIIRALAEDQPEIAYVAISRSPVLTDEDLVDIAARGSVETRALIASRSTVSCADPEDETTVATATSQASSSALCIEDMSAVLRQANVGVCDEHGAGRLMRLALELADPFRA